MYGHSSSINELYPAEFLSHFPLPNFTPPSTSPSAPFPPPLAVTTNESDPVYALDPYFCCTASNYGSPSSLASCGTQTPSLIQRSVSKGFQQLVSSPTELLDTNTRVRKVSSTSDLQRIKLVQNNHLSESPLSNESSIIEGMNKACRYTPDEKKERIERYRSKRNHRNFKKKIKYECRKTLADRRQRVKGRFARNEEIEKVSDQIQWNYSGGNENEDDEEDDDNWINFLDVVLENFIP